MKLAKFYFKHYLTRSTRSLKRIEEVIHSQAFHIYRFDPKDPESIAAQIMQSCNCWEYGQHHKCFLYLYDTEKFIFIRDDLNNDDQLVLLFHEEAHIWYNHPNVTGFTEDTDTQQEVVANRFLPRLRFLKSVISALLLITILPAGLFLFPKSVESGQISPTDVAATVTRLPDEPTVQTTVETVYITSEGSCYHTAACSTVKNSDSLSAVSITTAENLHKEPCHYCINQKEKSPLVDQTKGPQDSSGEGRFPANNIVAHPFWICK